MSLLRRLGGLIAVRLMIVNLAVLLVPVAGLEFARIYEDQLLLSLERDMRNQAALVRAGLEGRLEAEPDASMLALSGEVEGVVTRAARSTRTRVRVLDADGAVVADSHRSGPPEGEERASPKVLPEVEVLSSRRGGGERWPEIPARAEVLAARGGSLATMTRVRERSPGVFLFLAEPVLAGGEVRGVVYVTRSTQPVLVELYKIRSGLLDVLAVAVAVGLLITALLAYSISRPLAELSRAARAVARGDLTCPIPIRGSGEVRDIVVAFAAMRDRLVERLRFAAEFAADVVHELKTPVTSVRGAAELLLDGAWSDEPARTRFLGNILRDTEHLDRLARELLQLGRVEAGGAPRARVDLTEIARDAAERFEGVTLALAPGPRWVQGNRDDLTTAIVNLLANARRHSPSGEAVTLELGDGGHGRHRLVVRDRGEGISEANQARVFDRFFTTAKDEGGTGLGLPIVRAIVQGHGGEVALESRVGEGTTVTLRLPAAPPEPGRVAAR